MAVTKESLAYQGKNLSNILGGIANQIQQNKISAAKQEVLAKYQDPSKVFLNPDGSSKSSYEVQQQSFPDYMWLQSNGFENEAKGLEKMFTSYNADLDAKAKNTAFLKLLTPGQQNMFKGSDLNRIDAAQTFKDYTSTLPEPDKPIKPIFQKHGQNLYEITQSKDGKLHYKIASVDPEHNVSYHYGNNTGFNQSLSLNPQLVGVYKKGKLQKYVDVKKPFVLDKDEVLEPQVKEERMSGDKGEGNTSFDDQD